MKLCEAGEGERKGQDEPPLKVSRNGRPWGQTAPHNLSDSPFSRKRGLRFPLALLRRLSWCSLGPSWLKTPLMKSLGNLRRSGRDQGGGGDAIAELSKREQGGGGGQRRNGATERRAEGQREIRLGPGADPPGAEKFGKAPAPTPSPESAKAGDPRGAAGAGREARGP